jgi:hypothetical protein
LLKTGLRGAIASAAAAAIASRIENRHAARPMNAVAHIADGGAPSAADGDGRRNTLLGTALHAGASVWWASFFELALARQARPRPWATACAIAGIAYLIDYYVVGKRFRPGFEAFLSRRAMFAVYAALAAGYALSGHRGALVGKRQHQRERAALPRAAAQGEPAAEQPGQLAADR